jgi:hypothetical protein
VGAGLEDGRPGAIAVLSRGSDPSAGHVGFLLGEAGRAHLLWRQPGRPFPSRPSRARILGAALAARDA